MQARGLVSVTLVDGIGIGTVAHLAQPLVELARLASHRHSRDGFIDFHQVGVEILVATKYATERVHMLRGDLTLAPGIGHAGEVTHQGAALEDGPRALPGVIATGVEPACGAARAICFPLQGLRKALGERGMRCLQLACECA